MALNIKSLESITKAYVQPLVNWNTYMSNPYMKLWSGMATYEPFDPFFIDHYISRDIVGDYGSVAFRRRRGDGEGKYRIILSAAMISNGKPKPIPEITIDIDGTSWHMSCEKDENEYDYDLHDPTSIERIQIIIEYWRAEHERKRRIWGGHASIT